MLSRSSRHIADRDLKVLGLSVNKSPSTKSVQFSATTFASTSIAGSPLPESQTRDPYTSWLDFDDDDLDDDGGDHGADGGDTAELDVLSSDDIKKTSLQISFNTKHPRLVTFLTVAGDVQHALVQALLGFELEPSLSLQDFGLVPDRTSTPGTVKLFGDPLSESTSAAVTFALCQIPERHATPPPPYEARMPDTKTWGNLPAWEIADEQNVCSLKNHQFNDIDDSLCSAFRHSPGASLCQMSNTLVLTIDDSPASRLSAMTTLLQVAELNAPDGVPEADASLPSAIVVMTATRTPVELEAWDPDFTTDTFFDQMLLSDVSLTSLKDRVRRRFLHFRVLRIPNFGSSLRKTQIDKLWAEIHNNCGQALPYFPTQPKDATTMQFEPAEPEGLVLGGRALSLSESCTTDILRLSILDSIERRLGCGLALMVDLIIAVGVAEAIAVSMTQD
ncbi:hypothetical protein K461DRAFT_280328 [Myriangium duriaei CBS 260.36]|uniref:Uncharacterized protein n=1 Tax=Myriangium duriaei CBS 260.36 TaxID=1168546 RepID=A0A9P4IYS8_9PEZI|nr:hypothetical protein K461DRAFT_280328 [Myriangium duriaei CBS 260.36]